MYEKYILMLNIISVSNLNFFVYLVILVCCLSSWFQGLLKELSLQQLQDKIKAREQTMEQDLTKPSMLLSSSQCLQSASDFSRPNLTPSQISLFSREYGLQWSKSNTRCKKANIGLSFRRIVLGAAVI